MTNRLWQSYFRTSTYEEGERVTVTATANTGYSFVNWTEGINVVSTRATYRFRMETTDRNLVANFQAVAPSWPRGVKLSATNVTSSSVMLKLNKQFPNAEKYVVYFDGCNIEYEASAGTTFYIEGLTPSTFYTFTVQAVYAGSMETTDGPSVKVKTKK